MPGRSLLSARIRVASGILAAGAVLALSATMSACGPAPADDSGPSSARGTRPFLYVGGETGLHWYSFNQSDGTLEAKGNVPYQLAATYMAASADGKFLYSVLRTVSEPKQTMAGLPLEGHMATYSINPSDGGLTEIARISSFGDRPTYVSIDKTGKFLLLANNLGHLQGNSIIVYPILSDGKLGQPVQRVMTGIRAHQVRISPNNKYVYVPNIDSDTVSQFAFDQSSGTLTRLDPATVANDKTGAVMQPNLGPLAGARHLDFHPNGKWVYLSNEYAATVVAFEITGDGTLKQMGPAVAGLPSDYDPMARKWQSEIRVTPNGKWVFAGERVHQTIAGFAIDPSNGLPKLLGHAPSMGKTPRHLTIDPSGKWLVAGNQESDTVVVYKINDADGSLQMAAGPLPQPTPYVHLFVMLP
jgi:6-phosphogluconolactonase